MIFIGLVIGLCIGTIAHVADIKARAMVARFEELERDIDSRVDRVYDNIREEVASVNRRIDKLEK